MKQMHQERNRLQIPLLNVLNVHLELKRQSIAVSKEIVVFGGLYRAARFGIHLDPVHRAPGPLRVVRVCEISIGEKDQSPSPLSAKETVQHLGRLGRFTP